VKVKGPGGPPEFFFIFPGDFRVESLLFFKHLVGPKVLIEPV